MADGEEEASERMHTYEFFARDAVGGVNLVGCKFVVVDLFNLRDHLFNRVKWERQDRFRQVGQEKQDRRRQLPAVSQERERMHESILATDCDTGVAAFTTAARSSRCVWLPFSFAWLACR